jgi:hypothetical protein
VKAVLSIVDFNLTSKVGGEGGESLGLSILDPFKFFGGLMTVGNENYKVNFRSENSPKEGAGPARLSRQPVEPTNQFKNQRKTVPQN